MAEVVRRLYEVETHVEAVRSNGSRYVLYVPGDVIPYDKAQELGLVDEPRAEIRTTNTKQPKRTAAKKKGED